MNLDDFKPQWQQRQRDLDDRVDHVVKRVRSRMSNFNSTIWRRDMLETIVAIGMIGWFGYDLFFAQNWLATSGNVVGILACILIVAVLQWAREKGKVARTDLPVEDYCAAELERVDRQIWLLRNVHWWYLGPLSLSIALAFASMAEFFLDLVVVSFVFLIFVVPLFAFIYWLNQLAVRKQLMPLRRELTDAMDADVQIVDAETA